MNPNDSDLLGYESYLADPTMRERIDAEVRHLQSQALNRFIATPVATWVRRLVASH